jgi:hypothetical protein
MAASARPTASAAMGQRRGTRPSTGRAPPRPSSEPPVIPNSSMLQARRRRSIAAGVEERLRVWDFGGVQNAAIFVPCTPGFRVRGYARAVLSCRPGWD